MESSDSPAANQSGSGDIDMEENRTGKTETSSRTDDSGYVLGSEIISPHQNTRPETSSLDNDTMQTDSAIRTKNAQNDNYSSVGVTDLKGDEQNLFSDVEMTSSCNASGNIETPQADRRAQTRSKKRRSDEGTPSKTVDSSSVSGNVASPVAHKKVHLARPDSPDNQHGNASPQASTSSSDLAVTATTSTRPLSQEELRRKRLSRLGVLPQSNSSSKVSHTDTTSPELRVQQREAWLNRVASSPASQKSAQQSSSSSASSSARSSPKATDCKKPSTVSSLSNSFATDLTLSPKLDGSGDANDNGVSKRQLSDVSNTRKASSESSEPVPKVAKTKAQSTPKGASSVNEPSLKSASKMFSQKRTENGDENGPSPQKQSNPVPKPVPAYVEKTTDIEKLKSFLEKVFDCTLILTDDIPRMRFSGGKMRVPPERFPTSLEDVESKTKTLVHQAFDKQINKVKCAVNAFNVCESSGSGFNDTLVDSAMSVIKAEAVEAIISHFCEESENNRSSEPGLWDSPDGHFELNVYQYETYNFLPRLVGGASDGVNICPSMLPMLLSHSNADRMVASLMHAGGSRFLASKRMDEMLLGEGVYLQALEVLVSDPKVGDCLAKILALETENAVKQSLGNYFQDKSALSELLSVSTLPTSISGRNKFQPSPAALEPFRSLRSFPNFTHDDVSTTEVLIQKAIRQLHQVVYTGLRRVVSNKGTREVALSWLSTLISLNELRTSSVMQDNTDVQPVCSDGFMLNVCAVMLEFFVPISQSADKLDKVDISYSASPACRLTYDYEACLAGGQLVSPKDQKSKLGALSAELQGQHSFITECFHLTHRALGITVIPAIKHYDKMHSHFHSQMELVKDKDKANEEAIHAQHVLVTVAWDTCLMETELVRGITTFYISEARLLLSTVSSLAEKHKNGEEAEKAQRKALSVVPEFYVKDMAQWFTFLAYRVLRVKPHSTKGITLTPFVDCCVMLLERPDLMPGPVPASMIVSALLAFMKDSDKDKFGVGRGWGSGVMSELAAMVHTCPSAQTKLGPALLRTYVSVDVVEGLDVDKDTFDKFNSRVQIGQLVSKLWSRSDCRASIISQCGTDMFQNFLDSILDTLLYMLHDSLSRIANVKKVETLQANEAEWNALSKRQQAEKDMFLRSEEKVGSGFMRQSKKTLKFLNLISQSEKVAQCFTRQPLATRAASTINGFLDSLCGAKAKSLKVKDMAKYEFNPVELLLDIMNIIVRITMEDVSRTDGYLVSMVKDPDFELANLEKAQSVIVGKGFASDDMTNKLAQLMEQIGKLAAEHVPVSSSWGEDDEDSWRSAFLELDLDGEEQDRQYTTAMQDKRFTTARIQDSYCFTSNLHTGFDSRSPKVKVIMKEMKQLATSLPVNVGASIFVRQDKDRMDVMRALVTGPTGTPYSLGCFCFDVYFPAAYPNVPPLVKIITTGKGTVRFNPNLYADGKVCLSLLGTWHAGDASEKWNPGKSSLYQVLVSIQSMILTPDPVFNEPGYERIKGTEEGEIQSRQYNWKIHLHTLRHAILGQLKSPPPGFERVIKHHFALQREAVLKQCAEWVKGCEDPDLLKRLCKAADAIFEQLMCLEVDFDEVEEDSDDDDDDDDEED